MSLQFEGASRSYEEGLAQMQENLAVKDKEGSAVWQRIGRDGIPLTQPQLQAQLDASHAREQDQEQTIESLESRLRQVTSEFAQQVDATRRQAVNDLLKQADAVWRKEQPIGRHSEDYEGGFLLLIVLVVHWLKRKACP